MGIPPEMLARVFDLFTQVDRSLDRSQGGLGIGLTLVRRLVEMHGGTRVGGQRRPGPGQRVHRAAAGAMARGHWPHSVADNDQVPAGRHIGTCGSWSSMTTWTRPRAWPPAADRRARGGVAYDGLAALEPASSFRPQAAVLDLGLPGLNGFELACRPAGAIFSRTNCS